MLIEAQLQLFLGQLLHLLLAPSPSLLVSRLWLLTRWVILMFLVFDQCFPCQLFQQSWHVDAFCEQVVIEVYLFRFLAAVTLPHLVLS